MGYSAYAAHPRVQLPRAELGLAQNPSLGTRTGPLPLVRAADALQWGPSFFCLSFLSILLVLTYSTAPRQSGLHLEFCLYPSVPLPKPPAVTKAGSLRPYPLGFCFCMDCGWIGMNGSSALTKIYY